MLELADLADPNVLRVEVRRARLHMLGARGLVDTNAGRDVEDDGIGRGHPDSSTRIVIVPVM